MRYQGSKARIAKEIIPIITEQLTEEKYFVDLFAGGMNMVDKVNHEKKIACDINHYVIDLWQDIKENGMRNIPKGVSLEQYKTAKKEYLNGVLKRFSKPVIGYIATCCSYGGGWFNGYANYNPKKKEDHIAEAWNGLSKQVRNFKHLESTEFCAMDYRDINCFIDLDKCMIYCDPPYSETKKYESDFDNEAFWQWVRVTVKKYGCPIYVSEYDAPDDFKCVWQKSVPDGMGTTKEGEKQNRKIEKLFIYNDQG